MKKYILIISLICCFPFLKAQDKAPFIYSAELEFQKGTLEYARGMALKLNHQWNQKEHAALQSGIMLSVLNRQGASPRTSGNLKETNLNIRLNFHTGYQWELGKNKRWNTFLEGYVGLSNFIISGQLDQNAQNFDRSFAATTTRGDFGVRLGFGYQLAPPLSMQFGLTASLIEVNHPLRFYTGIFAWGPDSMSLLALSLQYRFQ